ncbi:MAG: DUF2461 domain-containing protein [Ornithinibacter sp.]
MTLAGSGFTQRSFDLLAGLTEHNDRDWFHAHKDQFEESLLEPFEQLLEEGSDRLTSSPYPVRGSRQTMFRLARDVRFSADKSPYNCQVSGLLTRSGTKGESAGLVYVQIGPSGGMLAGGLYQPGAARLAPLRQDIIETPGAFERVIGQLRDAGRDLDRSDAVKTMPRGFAEHADDPWADVIRLKQLVVVEELPRSAWLDDTVADRLVAFATDIAPLLQYVRAAAG